MKRTLLLGAAALAFAIGGTGGGQNGGTTNPSWDILGRDGGTGGGQNGGTTNPSWDILG